MSSFFNLRFQHTKIFVMEYLGPALMALNGETTLLMAITFTSLDKGCIRNLKCNFDVTQHRYMENGYKFAEIKDTV